jgi:hypothetical protein
MATITLAVPDDLKREMEQFKEMNWSEVARSAIKEKVSQLSILKAITSKSKLTDQDALDLGKKINKTLHARYQEAN